MPSTREAYGVWDLDPSFTSAATRQAYGVWDLDPSFTSAATREAYGVWDIDPTFSSASTGEAAGVWDLNPTDDTPTPHIWTVVPSSGEEGWEFRVVGSGFGATQATYDGFVELNGVGCAVISWTIVPATGAPPLIDPATGETTIEHGEITAIVPVGATSGLVVVTTDGA